PSSWGAEGGTTEYIGGVTGGGPGFFPIETGGGFTNDLYLFTGRTSALAVNGKVALDVSTDVYMEIAQVTVITDKTILGGTYGFGMAVPGGYVSVDAAVQPLGVERSTDTYGLGDLIIVPAAIGWHEENWHTAFAFSVFAPSGRYDREQPVNLSKHYWAFDAAYSASYLTKTGLDLSGSLGY